MHGPAGCTAMHELTVPYIYYYIPILILLHTDIYMYIYIGPSSLVQYIAVLVALYLIEAVSAASQVASCLNLSPFNSLLNRACFSLSFRGRA
jgi:hypothetical protein